jgi:hypothetical protein
MSEIKEIKEIKDVGQQVSTSLKSQGQSNNGI